MELIERVKQHLLWTKSIGAEGKKLDDPNLCFRSMDFSGYDLNGAEVPLADFSGAILNKTIFNSCFFPSAKFCNATLNDASFVKANLDYADFSGASLRRATFIRADMVGTTFMEANVEHAILRRGFLFKANLTKANLSFCDLEKAHFEETIMCGTILTGAKNIETATLESIYVGEPTTPILLVGDEAKAWLSKGTLI